MTSDQTIGPTLEIAHVLFMDIVSYSKLPMDEQQRVIKTLQDAVRSTSDFRKAQEREQLIRLPTGDGMALVFFGSPEAAARCALELHRVLRDKPVPLRIGLHTGPVYRMADINANRNVSGGGINMAQRVMDCGDAGHILISATAAEMLGQLSNWADSLHELGEAEVKHGVKVHVFNLYTRDAGNPELPKKFAVKKESGGRSASGQPQSPLGSTLGHYKILRTIGAGGMGVVYEAADTRLGRHVALKVLPEHLMQDDELALERFRREATLASSLNHPNICTVHDIGFEAGQHFIVLELLEGESLKNRIDRGAVPLEQLVEWGIQIADALDAAHQAGVVHRDIKPGNIFVTKRDNVKLVDFGLAKIAPKVRAAAAGGTEIVTGPDVPVLTSPGTPLGTIAYMSPEQARGEDLDARTDIFSFGAVLYEMATGRSPFSGTTTAVVFDSILNKAAPPINTVDPTLPQALQKIVQKTLQKNREARYRSSAELRDELKRLRGATTTTHAVALGKGAGGAAMSPAKLALLAGVVTIAVAGGLVWQMRSSRKEVPAEASVQPAASVAVAPQPASAQAKQETAPTGSAAARSEVTATTAAKSETAPSAQRQPASAVPAPAPVASEPPPRRAAVHAESRAAGQFSGRLKNTTMGAEAPASVTIGEENGLVTGCLQVSPPLGGSGPISGVATGNQVLLNTTYRGGRIEFRGQLSATDELRGTYTVFATNGRVEQGSFTFSRRSAQGPAAGFDPRSCPQ